LPRIRLQRVGPGDDGPAPARPGRRRATDTDPALPFRAPKSALGGRLFAGWVSLREQHDQQCHNQRSQYTNGRASDLHCRDFVKDTCLLVRHLRLPYARDRPVSKTKPEARKGVCGSSRTGSGVGVEGDRVRAHLTGKPNFHRRDKIRDGTVTQITPQPPGRPCRNGPGQLQGATCATGTARRRDGCTNQSHRRRYWEEALWRRCGESSVLPSKARRNGWVKEKAAR
jgi:hypothetical protein